MATTVHVNVHAYTTTHVATNLIRSLKQIVVACGLDASKLLGIWQILERGVAVWLGDGHLRRLILEVYDPATKRLATRFDFEIDYGYHALGNGDLWLDPDTVNYAVRKCGAVPSSCWYDILAQAAPGHRHVDGWTTGILRSTAGLRRRGVGAAVGGGNLGASLNYWRS